MKIMIGLLGKPEGKMKPEGGLLEPEMEMPGALMDEAVNRENKAIAIEKAHYGPSEDKMRYCGNCENFKTEYPTLEAGQGFCEVWQFKCAASNLCAAWEFNEPDEESEESGDESEMED